LAVGAYKDTHPGGSSNSGAVYVFYGGNGFSNFPAGTGFTRPTNNASNYNVVFYCTALGASSQIGYSLAIGDVNGDGVADLLVGAPAMGQNGRAGSGSVYALYGGN